MSFAIQETRALIRLSLPILATQLAQIGMGTVDTVMSGHISTEDLAAVAIGTSLWTPVWLFVSGVLMALSPLVAAENAQRQSPQLPQLLAAGLFSGIILGMGAGLMLWFIASFLSSYIDNAKTAYVAANYLRAIALGMPFAGIFLAYRFYAEALEQPFPVTRIMLIGLAMNVPVNGLFIYGWFGLPQFGGIGCGIGSSLVFIGMTIALMSDTHKHRLPEQFPLWQTVLKPVKQQVLAIFRIGVPIGAAVFFEVSLFAVIALFLTDLGPTVVAGHQVALNLSALTFMIPLSISMALTVRVSYWRGKAEPHLARQTAWLGIKVNFVVSLLNASLITLLAHSIARLYSPDAQVVNLAASLLFFAAIFQLSDAIQVAGAGALRAYHDTVAIMLITLLAYWFIGLGSGYYLAFYWPNPLGAQGFWTGLIIGLSAAAVGLSLRLKKILARDA